MKRVLHVSLALALSFCAAVSAFAADPYPDVQETDAFTPVSSDYNVEDKSKTIVVPNMPRIRSQGSFDTCAGCVAATIAQKYICDKHPDYVGLDCAKLPSKMEVSQLYMLSMNHTNEKGQTKGDPYNHTSLKLRDQDGESTAAVKSLLNVRAVFTPKAESCYPFDRLVEKYGNFSAQAVQKMLDELSDYYIKFKVNGPESCTDCVDRINSALLTHIDAKVFATSLKKDTFAEFLYNVVFSKPCDFIETDSAPRIDLFPKVNSPSKDKSLLLEKLVAALGNKVSSHPVALSNVCAYTQTTGAGVACITHTVAVSGYKVLCRRNSTDCKFALKVHNCWGMEWQRKSTNDGWVDGAKLLDNVSRERDEIVDGALSWYY